jgi:hypothetical protein
VRVELSLDALLLVSTPRLAARVRLRSDAFSSAPVEVVYDSVEEAVLPPACPGCGQPTTEWRLLPPPVGARDQKWLAACPPCHDPPPIRAPGGGKSLALAVCEGRVNVLS